MDLKRVKKIIEKKDYAELLKTWFSVDLNRRGNKVNVSLGGNIEETGLDEGGVRKWKYKKKGPLSLAQPRTPKANQQLI